jgi:hypothetical protein
MSSTTTCSAPPARNRWLTPDRLLIGILVVQLGLWTLDRYGWLGFADRKGWPVLAAVGTVFTAVVLVLLCLVVSSRFRARFHFRMTSLLLLMLVAAVSCGWLSTALRAAKRQQLATGVVLRAGGAVHYRKNYAPEALRSELGNEFFADVDRVEAQSSGDPFDPFASGTFLPRSQLAGHRAEFNEDTLLRMTKSV